ncbi:hypothetical protein MRS76_19210 [Rhizobiaceae bacterium n13]|uniref:hypothetical protein n=1 Tax=Ferirhizobium litorale TaxID=2927786 RepID=UPI0024B30D04|nr:hypothetical protein [Fererhizobium litorale]MDI7864081.1 hypothetical protein [Fererhizobium litorale]
MNELAKLLRTMATGCRDGAGLVPCAVGKGPNKSEQDEHISAVHSACDELEELAETAEKRDIEMAEFTEIHNKLARLKSPAPGDLFSAVVDEIAKQ